MVRQYDAHSWVEAYFPPYGWLEFDPTPPYPSRSRSGVARWFNTLADAVSLWWCEGVVNYDVWKQFRFIAATRSAINRFQHSLSHWVQAEYARLRAAGDRTLLKRPSPGVSIGFSSALALLGIAAYLWYGRRRPGWSRLRRAFYRWGFPGEQSRFITIYYREALDLLESYGLPRAPELTPLEFAQSCVRHPAGGPLRTLTDLYNRIRFGCSWSDCDLSEAERLLKILRSTLRSKSPSTG